MIAKSKVFSVIKFKKVHFKIPPKIGAIEQKYQYRCNVQIIGTSGNPAVARVARVTTAK